MARAVRFVLAEHGFRAGRFTVGYQSCDDGAPYGDVPIDKCLANGRMFAETPRLRGCHWVLPSVVVTVDFTEWTHDGRLRHPRFGGVRVDKSPTDVRKEDPAD